jgi:hypothetical protein
MDALDNVSLGGALEIEDAVGDYLCRVVAGEFAPTLTLEDFTDDALKRLAALGYCELRE